MVYFSLAGEGVLDIAVARKLTNYHGHVVAIEHDKRGKDRLDASIRGFMNASRHSPWLVFRDLDRQDCAVSLVNEIAPNRHRYPNFLLRICVRTVESWLLADRSGFAQYFGLAAARIPADPDSLDNPKTTLLNIVAYSRHRNLREGIIPREGSGRSVGPEYNSVLSDYILRSWNIERALNYSDSLRRASLSFANFGRD